MARKAEEHQLLGTSFHSAVDPWTYETSASGVLQIFSFSTFPCCLTTTTVRVSVGKRTHRVLGRTAQTCGVPICQRVFVMGFMEKVHNTYKNDRSGSARFPTRSGLSRRIALRDKTRRSTKRTWKQDHISSALDHHPRVGWREWETLVLVAVCAVQTARRRSTAPVWQKPWMCTANMSGFKLSTHSHV